MPLLGSRGAASLTGFGGLAKLGYLLRNSLRFRSSASAYLNRTPASAGNRRTWTYSAWIKRSGFGAQQSLFNTYGSSHPTCNILFGSTDGLWLYNYSSGSYNFSIYTSQVFRDPAAWYHIVVAVDTTQSTSSNRVKIYVNGSQVTSFSTDPDANATSYPSLNFDTDMNNATAHEIGKQSSLFYDGYMAEVNFIDGQQLTPSSFGKTDASTGQWIPIKFSGTYGTNGFYLPFNSNTNTTYAYGFNSTPSYLSATSGQGIMPTGTQTWSIEFWTKFNSAPSANWDFIHNEAIGGVQFLYQASNSRIEIGAYGQADVLYSTVYPSALIDSWNHFVATHDGTNLRIMMNGVLLASTSTYTFASAGTTRIGTNDTGSSGTLAGYISNLRVCVGSIPTSYQTSSTTAGVKVYTPPTSDLTATSQGATSGHVTLLTCQGATVVDSSPTPKTLTMTGTVASSLQPIFSQQIFVDKSGNENNWLQSNTQTGLSNTYTYDSMTDVPTLTNATTANYATLNPLDSHSGISASAGNLQCSIGTNDWRTIRSTIQLPSGKWYFEFQRTTNTYAQIGVGTAAASLAEGTGDNANSWCIESNTGNKRVNNVSTSYGSAFNTTDITTMAVDTTGGSGSVKIWWGKNGTWFASGDPAAGTNAAFTNLPSDLFVGLSPYSSTIAANFGQQGFAYTAPSGFKALNTFNLP